MTDSMTAIAVGDSGVAIRTTDGGASWLAIPSGTGNTLQGIAFSDPSTGTMVGLGGTILRTTSGGLPVGVERFVLEGVPSEFSLEQNYPNPFNGTTTIAFSLARHAHVRLTVYSMLGQRVATLADGEMNPGSYDVSFDARNLASGVYFYTLSVPGYQATRKLLLLK